MVISFSATHKLKEKFVTFNHYVKLLITVHSITIFKSEDVHNR